MNAPRGDKTEAWRALQRHFDDSGHRFDLRDAFAADADRFAAFTFAAPDVFTDLSKCRIDSATLDLLLKLAAESGVEAKRDAMFRGDIINITEGRAVLHTALRAPRGAAPFSGEVHAVLDRLCLFVDALRARIDSGASPIRHVVNIGIGGSDLGPQMVVRALDEYAHRKITSHFVSNVDGHDLSSTLRCLVPNETLFIVASKTFTTQETITNATTAKAWFLAQGGTDIASHFVATTSNVEGAATFGIDITFGFWDWVGGRYSLWSAIGLPIAIAIGSARFRELLAGAHAMDRHFAETPPERNVPLLLGLVDVWYRNFHRFTTRCVAPYHQGLSRLPAYLQQLEMESNGKRVDLDGEALVHDTSPVLWGEPGTNGQHAYFQMLHQGTDVTPVEFILVKEPASSEGGAALAEPLQRQHRMLLSNGLAQSQALMLGKTTDQALAEKTGSPGDEAAVRLAKHRTFPGNRPSVTHVLQHLTPHALGALIAMFEHRVFTSGVVWGIDSFDQWGVELGKSLSNELLPLFETGRGGPLPAELDASTAGLLRKLTG